MLVTLVGDDPRPVFRQIVDEIARCIAVGILKPGEALPGVAEAVEPATADGNGSGPAPELDPSLLLPSEVDDDLRDVQAGDRVVLIVQEDVELARTVLEVARKRGFKGIVALRGDAGLALAREFKPDAIVLDTTLPVVDGRDVLDRLKRDP